jgi:hypothetical protein
MAFYRKKPVVIEAERVSMLLYQASNDWYRLPIWVMAAYDSGTIVFLDKQIIIKTLEGNMTAEYSDLIIKGVKGELYPCKPEIFSQTYEYVEESIINELTEFSKNNAQ